MASEDKAPRIEMIPEYKADPIFNSKYEYKVIIESAGIRFDDAVRQAVQTGWTARTGEFRVAEGVAGWTCFQPMERGL
jgi:hypothetical protein